MFGRLYRISGLAVEADRARVSAEKFPGANAETPASAVRRTVHGASDQILDHMVARSRVRRVAGILCGSRGYQCGLLRRATA